MTGISIKIADTGSFFFIFFTYFLHNLDTKSFYNLIHKRNPNERRGEYGD